MAKITHEQKYKTPEERVKAFQEWCADRACPDCVLSDVCGSYDKRSAGIHVMAQWLALEDRDEKPEPCQFCGSRMSEGQASDGKRVLMCDNGNCGYITPKGNTRSKAVAAHNRICHAVKAAKEGEHRLKRAETCINKCYSNITNRAIDPGSACLNIATLIREYRGMNAQTKESEVAK